VVVVVVEIAAALAAAALLLLQLNRQQLAQQEHILVEFLNVIGEVEVVDVAVSVIHVAFAVLVVVVPRYHFY